MSQDYGEIHERCVNQIFSENQKNDVNHPDYGRPEADVNHCFFETHGKIVSQYINDK